MISIIIPIKNASLTYLDNMINALNYQNCHEEYEVIFVDYGSDKARLEQFDEKLTESFTFIHSKCENDTPYEARNYGIKRSKGDIIILLDLFCVPAKNWLDEGINYLKSAESDIVAGDVKFNFENYFNTAKLFDSLFNIKMEESVSRGFAKTANLFIKRKVFDDIGTFPDKYRSGGDVMWTSKAVEQGFKIGFSKDAVVYKYCYSYKKVIQKMWRVTKGQKELQLNTIGKTNPLKRILHFDYYKHMSKQVNVDFKKPLFVRAKLLVFFVFLGIVNILAKKFG